ncbi:hypothetical protein [Sphingobacterium sp. BIGb0165]|uniref:hypothetical protein n=1 Tax=Sphingobacterium sp. BIGb0165 TaxID=2940615 RepID=UPI002168537A|nr:hypothetical protein [Sphingobacterium sp. BIGb0165]MCS4226066.1 hypothetical protein [Sphingobacterium sp. BIGb0165]
MKINLLIKGGILVILASCQSPKKCEDPICLKTIIKKTSNNYLVRLEFKSKIDTVLKLDERMFAIGCPDYWEDPTVFYKTKNPDALKHSQIIVENTDDQFRLLSSQFIPEGESIASVLPNCAFLEEFELMLKKDKVVVYEFAAGKDQNKLRVSTSDRKVKLHLYLKNYGHGIIISSNNWIDLNSYISE